MKKQIIRLAIGAEALVLSLLLFGWAADKTGGSINTALFSGDFFSVLQKDDTDFIKWVDFNVPCEAMTQAFRYDVATCQDKTHLNWIDLLACLGARYGGDFSHYQTSDMDRLAESLKNGASLDELTKDMKHFTYYKEAYTAVLGGLVGYYDIEIPVSQAPAFALENTAGAGENESHPQTNQTNSQTDQDNSQTDQDNSQTDQNNSQTDQNNSQTDQTDSQTDQDNSQKVWVTKYGLKAFYPLAKNFPCSQFNDFGVSRSYGFRRQHLGHDMMGQTGTPIIAVESGVVEAIGWNRYGGWRLGIRSFDKKRYYYYAHLRKNYPYQSNLKEGSIVTAGDVIGYMGRTGYSTTENTNNIDEPHLHFGIQLIFDESQKESSQEIWINCYEIVKFLSMNRSECVKVPGTKEWTRIYQMHDPLAAEYQQ